THRLARGHSAASAPDQIVRVRRGEGNEAATRREHRDVGFAEIRVQGDRVVIYSIDGTRGAHADHLAYCASQYMHTVGVTAVRSCGGVGIDAFIAGCGDDSCTTRRGVIDCALG